MWLVFGIAKRIWLTYKKVDFFT